MTPDFDRLAREILGSSKFHDRGGVPAIAAALRSVWNHAIADAAEFLVNRNGYSPLQETADELRKRLTS